jgi:hypothetical protein
MYYYYFSFLINVVYPFKKKTEMDFSLKHFSFHPRKSVGLNSFFEKRCRQHSSISQYLYIKYK